MRTRRYPNPFGPWWLLSAVVLVALVGPLLVARLAPGRWGPAAANSSGQLNATSAVPYKVAMAHMVMATAAADIPDAPTLQPEGWTATASDQLARHPASAVLDSNPATYWSSQPSSPTAALPQWITIDMRGTQI